MTLYHYTNEMGAAGIAASGVINASTDTKNDAVYGPGKPVSLLTFIFLLILY